jgi:23S rRNA (uracil1939-C5)-methyltransferase
VALERATGWVTVKVDVTVRGIAAGGAGVADLPDGRVVFVPRTAPGDRASVQIERSKPRWAIASLCELIEPSRERRQPPCVLYHVCGGCQLQHLPYARQIEWKARVVADALIRIGRLDLPEPPPIVGSPRETHYRQRITFALRRLAGGRVVAGFHALDRPGRIVDVHNECLLPQASLLDAWRRLRSTWGHGAALLARGDRLRLTLRDDPGGTVLVVEGGHSGWSAEPLLSAAGLAAVWHRPGEHAGAPRLVAGTGDAGSPAFMQVNVELARPMVEHVLELAGEPGTAVDAYAGAGEYATRLTEQGWKATAIELDPAACAAARRASRDRFAVLEGRVEDRLPEVLPTDLLIVNPPRAGLDTRVVQLVSEHPPRRIVYVSCDPATLARDVAALGSAYRATSVRCFDLFPQTAHVETVLALVREGAA